MSIELDGRIVLITGANRGIGKTILEAALSEGAAKVYAAVRNVHSVADLVDAHGGRVVPLEVDLQKPETIRAAARVATDVDVVINNAGILRQLDILSPDSLLDYEAEHQVNVLGWLHIAQTFAPILRANGGGALVQLNSVASLRSFADFAGYCASKAASYSFTQAIRDRLADQGTLVVSVHPGPIKTGMAETAGLDDMAEPPSVVAEAIIEGLRNGQFHVFPDSMAKDFEAAYEGFAKQFVEGEAGDEAGSDDEE
jgi:NAD(P)-dependent dehydrogenase (short-subunit alcohol dehydrogenase family)